MRQTPARIFNLGSLKHRISTELHFKFDLAEGGKIVCGKLRLHKLTLFYTLVSGKEIYFNSLGRGMRSIKRVSSSLVQHDRLFKLTEHTSETLVHGSSSAWKHPLVRVWFKTVSKRACYTFDLVKSGKESIS